MNEANVAALHAALIVAFAGTEVEPYRRLREIAELLASRGVLVPSALTPEQCDEAIENGIHVYSMEDDESDPPRLQAPPGWYYDFESGPFIRGLERIAKGEGT